jgi:hypothetical protein
MTTTPMDPDSFATALLDKIKRMGGSGDNGRSDYGDDYDTGRGSGRIPHERFQRVLSERNAARQQIEDMAADVAKLQQGYAAATDALRTQTAEQVVGIQARHQEDLGLVEMGFRDPLGRGVLRQAWDATPKGERGKSPAEWWSAKIEAHAAHAADPDNAAAPSVPLPLQGYMPQAEPPAQAGNRPAATASPPTAPTKRTPSTLANVPTDQGMAAYLSGLRDLESGPG